MSDRNDYWLPARFITPPHDAFGRPLVKGKERRITLGEEQAWRRGYLVGLLVGALLGVVFTVSVLVLVQYGGL